MIKNSDKNKIVKLYNSQKELDNDIFNTNLKNAQYQLKINASKTFRDQFNKKIDLSTDWVELTKLTDLTDEESEWDGKQYSDWIIELGILDIRFLHFLKYDIIYKLISDDIEIDSIVGLKNFFFSYEDVDSDNEYHKKVSFHASIYFRENSSLTEMNPIQAKLILIWAELPLVFKYLENTEITVFDTSYLALVGWTNGVPIESNPVWPGQAGGGGMAG